MCIIVNFFLLLGLWDIKEVVYFLEKEGFRMGGGALWGEFGEEGRLLLGCKEIYKWMKILKNFKYIGVNKNIK